ncbi:WecB/TagA/CpsF family glycosyltransferase [Arcicella sp. LKC2W]|uniref:WecB/TagA/CpsF family glycosyltransferase n=1 Tax=Arcicella sp. LKC2W TaxID=2984198 RepID=UPI002B211C37|nr:WecB/TagA/CpsF family glycosyltransferase [Arcicella sp. LKC2W]MEA5458973.1 WecB/TagA/CpsF family glycosyltransferase [Arcicella sp. LKC2W]
MQKHFLISINISKGLYQDFINEILNLSAKRQSSYVCVANVHMCIEAYHNSSFADVVNNADIVTPDGKPLVFGIKWLDGIEQARVAGPDLMPSLLAEAQQKELKVFFYGATPDVLNLLVTFCKQKYPDLSIAGAISPPFRTLTCEEENEHINRINSSEANLVFVALGCPKQEIWMHRMKGKINAVMLGVGGAFPMLVGVEKRAPLWMQKNGLEWFYRLMQDPKRLFKRYFVTNSWFVYLLFKEKILGK